MKTVNALQGSDFQTHPVWEYKNDDEHDETVVEPVENLPVDDLEGKIVGDRIRLANGTLLWASIGNIDVNNPRSTYHFLTLSIEKDGRWFVLARYHDFNYSENGPDALARFLGLPIDEVFPLAYDVTRFVKGNKTMLAGQILREPQRS